MKAYPKIFAMGTRHVIDVHDNPNVEITEKIDGSQFAFGFVDGDLKMRSKGAMLYENGGFLRDMSDGDLFKPICTYVLDMWPTWQEEGFEEHPGSWVLYGETLKSPKHSTLKYNRIPKNHLMVYGAYSGASDVWGEHDILCEAAAAMGFEAVPQLHKLPDENIHQFLERVLASESVLGGPAIEGVVMKVYEEHWVGGQLVPVKAAKFVSEKFKEVHNKNWKSENTGRGDWNSYIEKFRTEARWEKAIMRMKEAGDLTGEPKDIGPLIKSIHNDIIEEEKDNIKNYLWQTFSKELIRKSTAGFPEWYKERIIDGV